jgi:hypothetical protein
MPSVHWTDVPELSVRGSPCLVARQQFWQQWLTNRSWPVAFVLATVQSWSLDDFRSRSTAWIRRGDLHLRSADGTLTRVVRQELAAWALAGELVRGLVRDAADAAAPTRKGRRAGQPVHPRQLSFTAARRAAITSIRQGTAAAGLPAAAVAAGTARLLAAVGRARHVTDRNRHRPRNTKARQAFEKAHRNTPTWIAEAVLDICGQAA